MVKLFLLSEPSKHSFLFIWITIFNFSEDPIFTEFKLVGGSGPHEGNILLKGRIVDICLTSRDRTNCEPHASRSNVFYNQASLFVTTHSLIAPMGQEMLSLFAGAIPVWKTFMFITNRFYTVYVLSFIFDTFDSPPGCWDSQGASSPASLTLGKRRTTSAWTTLSVRAVRQLSSTARTQPRRTAVAVRLLASSAISN